MHGFFPRRILVAVLAGAIALAAGCAEETSRDLLTDVAVPVAAKRDPCVKPNPKKCPPTPPVEPVEPELPPLFLESMRSPLRAAATPGGRLLVSDSRHNLILRVDPATRQPDQGFDVNGKPLGVALLDEVIYVGNEGKGTIEAYGAVGGELLASFGHGSVQHPSDIAVDPVLKRVFALDGRARQVKVFESSGVPLGTISGPGDGADRLSNPIAIAVDPARSEVLVSDYGSADGGTASIKIFGYDGAFVDEISGAGSCGLLGCSGGFSRPQGLAVGENGRVYVADALLSQVLVYDRTTGDRLGVLGGYPTLHVPTDVAITGSGDLFVVSNLTRTVEIFPGEMAP